MRTEITKTKTFKGCIGLNNIGLDYFDESINEFCAKHNVIDIKFAINNDNLFAMVFYKVIIDF